MIDELRDATRRMRTVLAGADPAAPVPACPGWTLDDLAEHVGRVHLWAAKAVTTGREPGRPPERARGELSLADWYGGCAATLLQALDKGSP